jgi:hypothetical protein
MCDMSKESSESIQRPIFAQLWTYGAEGMYKSLSFLIYKSNLERK